MPCTATITGKVGPNISATALVVNNILNYFVDYVGKKIFIVSSDQANKVQEFDINAATTFTTTISGGNYTITIS